MTERLTQHLSALLRLLTTLRCVELCQHRRIFAIFSLWIALLSASSADADHISSIKILERGIYRAETVDQKPVPGTTGIINTVQNPRLIRSTTIVVGQVGVRFGVRYALVAAEPDSEKVLKLVTVFPPAGLRDPKTGQVHYQNQHEVTVPVGVSLYWEYQFENPWEIADGIWQFEFWDGAKKLGQQRFCVQRLDSQSPITGLLRECRQDFLG